MFAIRTVNCKPATARCTTAATWASLYCQDAPGGGDRLRHRNIVVEGHETADKYGVCPEVRQRRRLENQNEEASDLLETRKGAAIVRIAIRCSFLRTSDEQLRARDVNLQVRALVPCG